MNELDKIKLEIYEAVDSEEITEAEATELFGMLAEAKMTPEEKAAKKAAKADAKQEKSSKKAAGKREKLEAKLKKTEDEINKEKRNLSLMDEEEEGSKAEQRGLKKISKLEDTKAKLEEKIKAASIESYKRF